MNPDAIFEAAYAYANVGIAQMSAFVEALPVPYAFGAGMLSAVNPCGFVMLPAFAAFYTGLDHSSGGPHVARRLQRAVWMGALVTIAFVAVFGSAGLLITLGGHALLRWSGWAGVVVGVLLALLGGYQLLSRRSLFANATAGVRVRRARSNRGVVLFGFGYAVCSLGCTLPVFLVVAGSVFLGDRDFAQSLLRFIEYALGMGAILAVVAIGVVVAQERMSRWARQLMPLIESTANVFLILAGLYIVWYWTVKGSVLL